MEELADALRRLTLAGYGDAYRAEALGLRSRASGALLAPEDFLVDEIVRFEGESDPSEESAVFALTSRIDATRGTYTVGYGALMDPLDAEMVRRLGGTSPSTP
jgi:hypothetical protein